MHPFKILLFVVFTCTSATVFSAKTEPTLKGVKAIHGGTQPKFLITSKMPELSTLKQRMAALNIPAVSVAFMEKHKISWTLTEGVIDLISQQKIDKNTLFQVASISNPMFASTLLQNQQKHGLNLDTDINKLLKIWQLPRTKGSKYSFVPFNRLLSHSAGATVHGFRGYDAGGRVLSIIDALKGVGSVKSKPILVDIEPSTRLRYSGGGTTLAELVLQERSRIPLPDLAQTLILDPLDLEHSAYFQALNEQLAKNVAVAYRSNGLPVAGGAHAHASHTAAGFWTTPSDLLKLASKNQSNYQGLDTLPIINKTVLEMLAPQIEPMEIGFFREKQDDIVTSFSYGRANDGFRANLFIHPQTGDGIAIMTNSDNGGELINGLLSGISEVYGWNEFSQVDKKVIVLKSELPQLTNDESKVRKPFQSTLLLVAEGEQF
jgi:CubicO group peptidase (beta-lactamase class C family)